MSAYDDETEPIDDPSYGELKAYYKSWGIHSAVGIDWEELPSEYCTKAQIGLNEDGETFNDNPDRLFFEYHKATVINIAYYHKKFKCIKKDTLELQGDFNSYKA